MRNIIGLMGVKGSGKDTCAQYLINLLGYKRIGFADALYREVADTFDVTVEFMGRRETKETDLPELALQNCKDTAFVQCVAEELQWDDLTPERLAKPLSPRFVMQLWGTEYRRRRGQDSYWLDRVTAALDAEPEQDFVITDVRFLNEFNFVGQHGGKRVRIRRPMLEEAEARDRALNGRSAHPSETELLGQTADAEVFNVEGNPDSLREGILKAVGKTELQPA